MNELNAWVLSEACAQAVLWPSDLQLAVNCSVFQLQRGNAAWPQPPPSSSPASILTV